MAAPSPVALAGGVVTWSIMVDGRPLDPAARLISLEVWRTLDQPPRARVIFDDGEPGLQTFPLSEGPGLPPGAALVVSLGYDAVETPVFSGTVRGQGLSIDAGGPSRLIVEATDRRTEVVVEGGADVASPVLTLTYGDSILHLDLNPDPIRLTPSAATRGRVRFAGSALPTPGRRVTLAGLGGRFNGEAAVTGVYHRVTDGCWTTELDVEQSQAPSAVKPHHVGRLRIHATIADGAEAPAVGERLQRLADGAIAAVLERVFDGLELGERLVKIDRLHLDLSAVRPERLEEGVMAALARTLPEALKQALDAQSP